MREEKMSRDWKIAMNAAKHNPIRWGRYHEDGIPKSFLGFFITENPVHIKVCDRDDEGNPTSFNLQRFPTLAMLTNWKFFPMYLVCLNPAEYMTAKWREESDQWIY